MVGDGSTSASILVHEARMNADNPSPAISVVVPVRNEAGNVGPLVAEIEAACAAFPSFEVVYVNDGSTDATAVVLGELQAKRPWLRHIRHAASCGQSCAVRTGVRA